ncbi:hypothetical protein B0A55_12830 [Friedmanniomyces simplex]|uniref:gamma-glutamylcyclotransferase n=1 Tax=Friedmanniomyces simplex TaxID=329884 RepID=A0A4U0VSP5_9PEZI|nr:hypothetical protein B0A55_12830 [Friedmanniomyces simplex]
MSHSTLYFAYGSNLWLQQMAQRCPTSEYFGIARLTGYRWIIYERGYANIVKVEDQESEANAYVDEVWGVVYSLQQTDEDRLDVNEGVPFAYTKEDLKVDLWQAHQSNPPNTKEKPQQVEMLVYINRRMTTPSQPKKEYIYRMNQGIKDAVKEGMPKAYVETVMRTFIPDVMDEKVAEVAKKQAWVFEDER